MVDRVHNSSQEYAGIRSAKVYAGGKDVVARFVPQPPASLLVPLQAYRHRLPEHLCVMARPILGGLHHEYQLAEQAA